VHYRAFLLLLLLISVILKFQTTDLNSGPTEIQMVGGQAILLFPQ